MNKKIEWYQEVLSLEPGSRVFFPLAKLFVENGQPEDAVNTLRQGLDRHPDYLEARMLLVELLTELERESEVHDQLERVINSLRDYPAFWRGWARSLPQEQRDLSVFLMLVASNLSGDIIKWTDVVFEGIGTLADRLVGAPLPPPTDGPPSFTLPRVERETTMSPDLGGHGFRHGSGAFRTKTMADLLASQGDVDGALEIYRELLQSTMSDERRSELQERIVHLEQGRENKTGAELGDAFSVHAKNRLISTLETLASRFEARVQS
ncbi:MULTISPECIES: tetratricopeptide repeat protein [unclassified Pseudodesulfovibrio]|uniref:tetratricopeptide repeat protein n=1 Tax=unclassified Pseudodesulfovibrio TaxID=2661612 RepID=UPI000FEBDAF9|nr:MULTISPECIES: tetratricopeptide repeat protein [unclassified Pseudodesulfovibrio]MCJ2163655.1 tetratricopeptide repeat protein [Pseudodesulfovibrio sp. S3-i]RWU06084.1 tetratricopeptide repeat protein [Pseudodesulfovibrio sp. S3]